MSQEQIYNATDEQRKLQEVREEIMKLGGIEEDAEHYIIPETKPDGKIVKHYVAKRSGGDSEEMFIEGLGNVERKEVVEAIQKIYPEMKKENLPEAIKRLRKQKKESR